MEEYAAIPPAGAAVTEEELERMVENYAKQFTIPDMPIHSENERCNAIKHFIAGYKARG